MSLQPGSTFAGRYRLLRPLGEGGIGLVWEAESSLFGRVALKVLHRQLASEPIAVDRFGGEARAASTISHPNVVRVLDIGKTTEHGPFMVMELCQGETLDVTLGARGAVGVAYAAEILVQVLAALQAAHALGIVHRDLKPANVIVVHPEPDRPMVKVLDFGIACRVHAATVGELGKVYGTPGYMAPEQVLGGPVDARADLHAAGAIFFELLTGRRPFQGRSEAEVMSAVLLRPPKPMRAFVRTLPVELEAIVRRCLAKDKEDRPSSAEALRQELLPFVAPARTRINTVPRQRKKSEPLPLVKRAGSGSEPPFAPPVPRPSDAPLPLVQRAPSENARRRPVLELVGEPPSHGDPGPRKR